MLDQIKKISSLNISVNIKEKMQEKDFQQDFLQFCQKKGVNLLNEDGQDIFQMINDFNNTVTPMEAFADRQFKDCFEKISELIKPMEEYLLKGNFSFNKNTITLCFNNIATIHKIKIQPKIESAKSVLVLTENAPLIIKTIMNNTNSSITDLIQQNPDLAKLTMTELGDITAKLIINALPADASLSNSDNIEFALQNETYQVKLNTVPQFFRKQDNNGLEPITQINRIKKLNLALQREYAQNLANKNLINNPAFKILQVVSTNDITNDINNNRTVIKHNAIDESEEMASIINLNFNNNNEISIDPDNNKIVRISSATNKVVRKRYRLDEDDKLLETTNEEDENNKKFEKVDYNQNLEEDDILELDNIIDIEDFQLANNEFVNKEIKPSLLAKIRTTMNTKVGRWAAVAILSLIGVGIKIGIFSDKKNVNVDANQENITTNALSPNYKPELENKVNFSSVQILTDSN